MTVRQVDQHWKVKLHPMESNPGKDSTDIGIDPIRRLAVAVILQAFRDATRAPDKDAFEAMLFLALIAGEWFDALGLARLGRPAAVLGNKNLDGILRAYGGARGKHKRGRPAKKRKTEV